MAELLRRAEPRRRALSPDERDTLLELIAMVPGDAAAEDPAVVRLAAYARDLDVPWWMRVADYRARLGDVAGFLASARRLANARDWGKDPTLPPPEDCNCSGCRVRRAEA